mmetsp:Transcript_9803/g.17275  ORF Transcript_9803/g.17275 Transcript_9803/m.17275 type:complete len:335 (+) Transcript_9803:31-1035(+)|eukprot:CAMPEP_0184518516 /NCGR_PEP_ID=MMETSP0198_2-20121128/6128_1 /TAXON_ID=1112570 /ORGANISM="Thraustochytrium sp., Strain LLF1b" /LENGTH=334 /DNA_ID=CAMNT_0026908957 /DNA_START=157 /DNA_END=1161 /DNA_ORIENTATION=+
MGQTRVLWESWRLVTLVILIVTYSFQFVKGEEASASRSSVALFVGKDEDESTLAKFRAKGTQGAQGSGYTCEFKRSTKGDQQADNAKQDLQQASFGGIHRDVEMVLAKLSAICVRKTVDYWKYELCFDNKITQTHGRDSFLLGTYSGMDGAFQLYDEGTLCEALPGERGRESRVEFVCDSTLRLLSVEEVSTCSYKVYVSTPLVCGHPEFLQNTRSIPGKGAKGNAGPPKDQWFLEVSEMNGGQIMCSVQSLSPRSDLEFMDFELSLSTSDSSLELKSELDLVRVKGRKSLSQDSKHYSLRRTDEFTRVTLASGRAFKGNFVYAMVQVVPTRKP